MAAKIGFFDDSWSTIDVHHFCEHLPTHNTEKSPAMLLDDPLLPLVGTWLCQAWHKNLIDMLFADFSIGGSCGRSEHHLVSSGSGLDDLNIDIAEETSGWSEVKNE